MTVTVEKAIRRYRPHMLPDDLWLPVAAFVVESALMIPFADHRRAVEGMRSLSRFVTWSYHEGVPLDRERVFHPDNVERYIEIGATHMTDASRATRRSDLRRFGRQVTRKAPWTPRPKRLRAEYRIIPYSATEVRRLLEISRHQPSPLGQRRLTGMLALGLGCGLLPHEMATVRADALIQRHGVLCLQVSACHPRVIPITHPYDDILAEMRNTDPEPNLLGFERPVWDRSPLHKLVEGLDLPRYAPKPNGSRLRMTWLLHHLDAGMELNELATMAAVTTWKIFGHLMPFMRPIPESEVFKRMARRPPQPPAKPAATDGE